MKKMLQIKKYLLLFMMLFSALINAQEAQKEEAPSADEMAKELANPNTVLGTMNFNFDYMHYQGELPGAESQNSFAMSFQPSLPIPLSKSVNLFVRPNIPLYFAQPVPVIPSGFESKGVELGNISADIAVGKTFPSKTVALIGAFGSFRTATHEKLRSPYTMLGPEVMVAQIFKWGVIGAMVNHSWSANKIDPASNDSFSSMGDVWVASTEGIEKASVTAGQYFYVVGLKKGWQIMGGPTWSFNHKASKGNKLTFPIATGANKVTHFGKLPIKMSLQYWYYVASPDQFGPQHQIRFTISPVVPLPW